jgi:hypothetical protein
MKTWYGLKEKYGKKEIIMILDHDTKPTIKYFANNDVPLNHSNSYYKVVELDIKEKPIKKPIKAFKYNAGKLE